MWWLIKVLLALAVLAILGLVAFAYLGPVVMPDDFAPPSREVVQRVDLGLD